MKKYQIIYADPPWSFSAWSDKAMRHVSKQYKTMTPEDIYSLDVASLADDTCTLFLWVTFPNLIIGLETIKRWGFTYKTIGFNWIKLNKSGIGKFLGMGYYSRSNSELCLLATKGKPKRVNANVFSIVEEPLTKHSAKPDEVRRRIVKLMGDIPRIELFARERKEGWDAFGNEVEGSIELVNQAAYEAGVKKGKERRGERMSEHGNEHCEECNFPLTDFGTPKGLTCQLCEMKGQMEDWRRTAEEKWLMVKNLEARISEYHDALEGKKLRVAQLEEALEEMVADMDTKDVVGEFTRRYTKAKSALENRREEQ